MGRSHKPRLTQKRTSPAHERGAEEQSYDEQRGTGYLPSHSLPDALPRP